MQATKVSQNQGKSASVKETAPSSNSKTPAAEAATGAGPNPPVTVESVASATSRAAESGGSTVAASIRESDAEIATVADVGATVENSIWPTGASEATDVGLDASAIVKPPSQVQGTPPSMLLLWQKTDR